MPFYALNLGINKVDCQNTGSESAPYREVVMPGTIDNPALTVNISIINHYTLASFSLTRCVSLFELAGYRTRILPQPKNRKNPPDVVIIRHCKAYSMLSRIRAIRRSLGWKPVLISWRTEPYNSDAACLDYLLPYNILLLTSRASLFLNRLGENTTHTGTTGNFLVTNPVAANKHLRHNFRNVQKTKFCNFIYSNPTNKREDFCRKLMEYKHVDCPGARLNNMSHIPAYNGKDGVEAKLSFIAACKFTIAFENASKPHYISEKIFDALIAGSLPIYWGCPEITQYVNPDCFINCHDFDSFDDVIREVIKIDNDPALYQKYVNAPPVLPDSRFHQSERDILNMLHEIVAEVESRRKNYKENTPLSFLRFCKLSLKLYITRWKLACLTAERFLGLLIAAIKRRLLLS